VSIREVGPSVGQPLRTRTATRAESPTAVPNLPATSGAVSAVGVPFEGIVKVTWGGVTSTIHVRLSGDGSTLPAASMARTSNVCSDSDSSP
jgi:hypothetical protein